MLFVPYSQFNLILLAYVIIVVTDESIFAYSKSNTFAYPLFTSGSI